MRRFMILLILVSFFLEAMPAEARNRRRGYYDQNGNWVSTRSYRARSYDSDGHSYREYRRKVRSHRRRRNVLLGVGALGLITGSGAMTGVGLGGAAANHFIDDEHRDN